MLGHWFRLNAMDKTRINKTVFNWSFSLKHRNKNWCFQIENHFKKPNIEAFMPVKDTCYSLQGRKHIINQVQSKLFEDFQTEWNLKLFSDRSIDNNNGGNKLRTYRMFKVNYQTEDYVQSSYISRLRTYRMFKVNYQTEEYVQSSYISRGNRSALAKFRSGVAPPP